MSRDIDGGRLVKELEDLLVLAETSAETIDRLVAMVDKVRVSLLGSVAVVYILASAGALALMRSFTAFEGASSGAELWLLGLGAASISLAVGAAYLGYSLFLRLTKARRELTVEKDIHDRIVSMIDSHKRRVYEYEALSPVALATFEIRMRRLDRTDKNA